MEKEIIVKVIKAIPYQLCPKCNGDGTVLTNKWNGGSSSIFTSIQTCDLCNGSKVIQMYNLEEKIDLTNQNIIDLTSENDKLKKKDDQWRDTVVMLRDEVANLKAHIKVLKGKPKRRCKPYNKKEKLIKEIKQYGIGTCPICNDDFVKKTKKQVNCSRKCNAISKQLKDKPHERLSPLPDLSKVKGVMEDPAGLFEKFQICQKCNQPVEKCMCELTR